VQGLSAANFRGKFRGQDVQMLSASIDTNPRHIVLLLDASGSMMVGGKGWESAKTISVYLILFAPPQSSIAEMAFAATVVDIKSFQRDFSMLMSNLRILVNACEHRGKAAGMTALYDAILRAKGVLGVPNPGDVICALTDGGDNRSRATTTEVENELLRSGVRLFAVLIVKPEAGRARPSEEIVGPGQLRYLAEDTGGNALTVPRDLPLEPHAKIRTNSRAEKAYAALQHLFRQLGEFYRLDVRLPETVDKPTKWKLEVIDADGRPMREVEVHYPRELMQCAKASP